MRLRLDDLRSASPRCALYGPRRGPLACKTPVGAPRCERWSAGLRALERRRPRRGRGVADGAERVSAVRGGGCATTLTIREEAGILLALRGFPLYFCGFTPRPPFRFRCWFRSCSWF